MCQNNTMITSPRERTLYYAAIQAELKRQALHGGLAILPSPFLLPGSTKPPSPPTRPSPTRSLPDFHELAAAAVVAEA
jgi:hypothetical protein